MLKNYTSKITANRSIAHIEMKLAGHGAQKIMKEYTLEGKILSLTFSIKFNGSDLPFKLPSRVKQCKEILYQQIRRPRQDTLKRLDEQAERTAWKILSDWVDIQMSMIDLAQVEFTEVFLPYAYDPEKNRTLFETMKANDFKKLLPAGDRR